MKKLFYIFAVINYSLLITNCFSQWVQVNNGMGNRFIYTLAANTNTVFAGTGLAYGVYISTNNGTNWAQTSLNDQYIWSLAVNGNNVFAGVYLNPNGVYLSTNNGTTWNQTSLNNREVYSLAVNGNYVYAGTWDDNNPYGVYLSTNNGTTWTQSSLNNINVPSLAVNGNNVFAGTSLNGVHLSTDNGTTWTQTSLNNQEVDALAVNGNNIFAGVYNGGVYKSTNNGTSWAQTSLNNQTILSLAVYGSNVFAGTYNGVYVSNNNGANWIQRNEGLPAQTIVPAFCISNNYIFASGYYPGVYRRLLGELVSIHPVSNEIPEKVSLSQNFPNPFNPTTKISFSMPISSFVSLKIYDELGKEVTTLVNEQLKPGSYGVEWNAINYASGVYYYKLIASDYIETKRMVLVK